MQRARLVGEKKQGASEQYARQAGLMVQQNKFDSARIRMEGSIREYDRALAAEALELYAEMLHVRADSLDNARKKRENPPDDTREACQSICYAASRFDELNELTALRDLLASMFGKQRVRDWANGNADAMKASFANRFAIQPPSLERVASALLDAASNADTSIEYDDLLQKLKGSSSSTETQLHEQEAELDAKCSQEAGRQPTQPNDKRAHETALKSSSSSNAATHVPSAPQALHLGKDDDLPLDDDDTASGIPDPGESNPYPDAHAAASAAASFADMAVNAAYHACAAAGWTYKPPVPQQQQQAYSDTRQSNNTGSSADSRIAERLQRLKRG